MFSPRDTLALCLTLRTATADIFILTGSLPDSDLDGLPVNAAGHAFYLGGSPASYCPTPIGAACPNVTETVFAAGLTALEVSSLLSWSNGFADDTWVVVPGGQDVYVLPNGAFGFTQTHTAFIPPGSDIGGFVNVSVSDDSNLPFEVLTWNAPDGTPVLTVSNGAVSYQVYAKTPAFNQTNGTTHAGLSPTYLQSGAPGAWQYI